MCRLENGTATGSEPSAAPAGTESTGAAPTTAPPGCAGRVHAVFALAPAAGAADGGKARPSFPKARMPAAMVTARGLEGDRQGEAVDAAFGGHGGPLKAVCLYSADVVRALQAEGHPIGEGTAGENISLSGIDWERVVPGVRIEIGEVLLEVTKFCMPCFKQRANFKDGNYLAISQLRCPGRSRVYAAVLREGLVEEGAAAVVHTTTRGARAYSCSPEILGQLARPPRGDVVRARSTALDRSHVAMLAAGVVVGHAASRLYFYWRQA
mmetsp:Transcript_119978/g.344894  ORF Transcript_119978/g.344894 Transcript_119978/m.344894 type:complete len:267 (+) Transcript_119978:68-868(+)